MTTYAGIATGRRANLIGSLWMVGAMAAFAVEDAIVKHVTARLPVAEVLVLFGAGGAIVFAAAAFLREEPLFGRDVLPARCGCGSASRSRDACSTRWPSR